jgi:hypothetical protein
MREVDGLVIQLVSWMFANLSKKVADELSPAMVDLEDALVNALADVHPPVARRLRIVK